MARRISIKDKLEIYRECINGVYYLCEIAEKFRISKPTVQSINRIGKLFSKKSTSELVTLLSPDFKCNLQDKKWAYIVLLLRLEKEGLL